MSDVSYYLPTKLISDLLVAGCDDSVDSVAEAATAGVIKCIPTIEERQDIMDFSPVIPSFLEVIRRCIVNEEDTLVILGFQHLQMTFPFHQPLINDHIEAITTFILTLLLDTTLDYDSSVKEEAINTLVNLIETLTKQFAKKKLIKPTLSMLMNRIAEEKGCVIKDFQDKRNDDIEEENEAIDHEEAPNDMIQTCHELIDVMAMTIPAKYFANTVFKMCEEALSSSSSSDIDISMRKAGCAVLGIIVEGLRDEARERIDTILPLLVKSLSDHDLHTREAAAFAVGQYTHHCAPEVYLYHQMIIPATIKACNHNNGKLVLTQCCYAFEHLCEQLKPNIIRPYLSSLVNCVGQLAQSNVPNVQEAALYAIASIAVAAGKEFQPYTDNMMTFLEPLLTMTEKQSSSSVALDCLGHIALGLGKEQFKPVYYELGMRTVMEFLQSNERRLMESAFIHIANMSDLMKKDFEPSIKDVIPYIFEALNESEVILSQSEGEMMMEGTSDNEGQEEDDDDDDDDDDNNGVEINQSGFKFKDDNLFIAKKMSAITAIGSLAKHTKSCFLPYLDDAREAFTSVTGVLSSVHVDIRSEAFSVFHEFIEVVADAANLPMPAKSERLQLSQELKELTSLILQQCFNRLDYDEEKKVVAKTVLTIEAVLKRLGAAALEINCGYRGKCSVQLTEKILTYLKETGYCQTIRNFQNDEQNNDDEEEEDPDDDDENEVEEEEEEGDEEGDEEKVTRKEQDDEEGDEENHVYLLMENIMELIGGLAKILSSDEFLIYFDQFHQKLLKFTKPSRSQADRDMAICCYVDVFECLGPLSMKYVDSILPVLKAALEDYDGLEAARRNAACCLGTLIDAAGKELVPGYLQFLQWLYPLCIREEREEGEENVGGGAIDNALGAVAKMISVAPEAIPLSQVLPVVFAALPMREDFNESTVVFKAFLHLIQSNDPTIIGMVKELLPLLVDNFKSDSEVPDATREVAGQAIAVLAANELCRDSVYSYLSTITDSDLIEKLQSGSTINGMIWNGK